MGIATSSRAASVDKKRSAHPRIFDAMEVVVCGDDPEVFSGKPAPDIYLVASKRLGVSPEDCLVFEDALTGVIAGKAAGMTVIAVPDPQYLTSQVSEKIDELTTHRLDSLAEINWDAWNWIHR
jgi:hypothetical protein